MRQQRRSFFYAGLILLLFGMFGFVYELQDPGTTVFFVAAAVFWFAVAAASGNQAKARRDRKVREAFYRERFGVLAPLAPWIPFLLLGLVWLVWSRFPAYRRIAWGLLAGTGFYTVVMMFQMRGYIRRRREQDRIEQRIAARSAKTGRRRYGPY